MFHKWQPGWFNWLYSPVCLRSDTRDTLPKVRKAFDWAQFESWVCTYNKCNSSESILAVHSYGVQANASVPTEGSHVGRSRESVGMVYCTYGQVNMGGLVCMSRWDILVCPGDVIICRRPCAEPGSGLFAAHFLPHDVTFSINRWCQVPPCGGNCHMYTSRSSGQNALRPWPWYFFVVHETLFYFVQRLNISKLIFMLLKQEV